MQIVEVERKIEQRQQLSAEHDGTAHDTQHQRILVGEFAADFGGYAHQRGVHGFRRADQIGGIQYFTGFFR